MPYRHVELSYFKLYDINKNTAKILRDFTQPLLIYTFSIYTHTHIHVYSNNNDNMHILYVCKPEIFGIKQITNKFLIHIAKYLIYI